MHPVQLSTERLVLREFTAEDCGDLHQIESDPEVARYQSFEPRTRAEMQAYLEGALVDAQERPRRTYDLAVVLTTSNRLIGRCGLQVTDFDLREAQVWYTLHRSQWGQGYIPEALRALVDFGFTQLRLHRIVADCDPANRPSYRVLEKIGMRREGHLVENAWLKGSWVDSVVYAILDREWVGSRRT
jgi:ribosomal-protein-alanine N-acetyltransferase